MLDQHPSRALPFAVRDQNPVGTIPAAVAELLAACRDRLVDGLATAFAGRFGTANDDLLGLADRATSLEQQQLYFAAMDFLTSRGQSLLRQFRSNYVERFDARVVALWGNRPPEPVDEAKDLDLVDAADLERDLAIGKLAARAACNCAEQLTALDRRLAALMHLERIPQDDNPLYPRALFAAMLQAFQALEVGEPLALTILRECERQTAAELPAIYDGLNLHLVDCGILPTIPRERPRAVVCGEPDAVAAGAPPLGATGQPRLAGLPVVDATAGTGGTPPPAVACFEDVVFGQLASAIAAASHPGGRRGVRRGSTKSLGPALGLAQLIAALTNLQRGRPDPRCLPGLGAVASDPGQGSVLQQLRATPIVSSSHPVDALTIDIVAMLFDAIFDDRDLSATLRAEVARLQIPVLKVALMDKAFFSNKSHPARRLLDLIASAGVGRNEAEAQSLMTRIQGIVSAVVTGFETQIDIFATQVRRLEEFLAHEAARAQTRATAVVEKLAQRDRQDLAETRVATEIEVRLAGPAVPALVGEFLDRHWRLVLVQTYVRHGDEAAPWAEALGAMDDLLWSVAPKRGADARNRLLTSLPDLLRRLRVPLEAVGLQDAWDPFFDQLIRLHMGALHKDSPIDTWEPIKRPPAAARLCAPAPGQRRKFSASQLVDTPHSIEYHTPGASVVADQPDRHADRHLQLAQSIGVGTWVEFESFQGTRKTLRVNWVSQLRGIYLFTNRQGGNALTLATTNLAEHLRKGKARVLSQAPLTDRAVAQLLQSAGPSPVHATMN